MKRKPSRNAMETLDFAEGLIIHYPPWWRGALWTAATGGGGGGGGDYAEDTLMKSRHECVEA